MQIFSFLHHFRCFFRVLVKSVGNSVSQLTRSVLRECLDSRNCTIAPDGLFIFCTPWNLLKHVVPRLMRQVECLQVRWVSAAGRRMGASAIYMVSGSFNRMITSDNELWDEFRRRAV